ncbi:response regulator [Paraburkholderia sabiae]|uniref:Response regulator n=1 Tax=Paraburkholderia sabiae TaxID=273251 RepID=A0ABU9QM48_9BURK|nr:response regulator [Paraburkholderia sabiae]WJZ79965.1 response regulator [Paraburkholderia sabiae]CAD6561254.1 Response regulator PleD [Paraburkholderia sabiae]
MSSLSPTILIIDDATSVRIIADILNGYDRRFATTGEMGLLMINSSPPDIVLADASMPGMTGFDLCEAVKGNPATSDVPVVLVSAYDAPRLIEDALLLGASDYLTKPLDARHLIACVRAQLRRRRALAAVASQPIADSARLYRAPSALLVARDTFWAENVASLLQGVCAVTTARNEGEAIRAACATAPVVAMVDMSDPRLDGRAICRALRATASGQTLYVMCLVELKTFQCGVAAMMAGIADAMSVEHALLRARVGAVIRETQGFAQRARNAVRPRAPRR